MNDHRAQLMEQGFCICRGMIGGQQMADLRQAVEERVEQMQAESVQNRKLDEPEGGAWETSGQPRVGWSPDLEGDAAAHFLEFALGDSTYGFSCMLLGAPEAAPTLFHMICNAQTKEHGPSDWHRDIHTHDTAPLDGLQMDVMHNGPSYLQWNIALFDDDVLWVVPGSHNRRNTAEEDAHVKTHPDKPLPGAICVDLKAGDGVVYINSIMHWASMYSTRKRRTIHLGYRGFGGPIGFNHLTTYPQGEINKSLPPHVRAKYLRFQQLWDEETDQQEVILRAILDKDADGFAKELAKLHPGEVGRIVYVIVLSKIAFNILNTTKPGEKVRLHLKNLAGRFAADELKNIWRRVELLDGKLKSDTLQYEPLFQTGPMYYNYYPMPQDFTVDDFVTSWGQ